jgi:hypothetical protein
MGSIAIRVRTEWRFYEAEFVKTRCKIVFVLFFVRFYRHLTTIQLFGFGA